MTNLSLLLSYEGINNTKQEQLKESSCQYQARIEVDLISIRQVLTICPFVHLPKGKKHPNRCARDVGTLIWRHQANHKCKHISLVWECFVFNPEILLLWPEAIFHSSYRIGMSMWKGQTSMPYSINKEKRVYWEVWQSFNWIPSLIAN